MPARRGSARKTVSKATTKVLGSMRAAEFKTTIFEDTLAKLKSRRKYIITVIGVLVVVGLLYYYKSLFIVAMVNGQPISRLSYYQELERQGGSQALSGIITKTLVFQEAAKQNVSVSDDEINKEIKTIEERLKSQGQQLDQLLAFQGLNREGLSEQIRLQKLAEKMASKDTKVTDAEIDEYLKNNPLPTGTTASSKEDRDKIREQLRQQKASQAIEKWLETLRNKAKVERYVN